MKESRAKFKTALNYCKKNELKIKKENLIQSFVDRNKFLERNKKGRSYE